MALDEIYLVFSLTVSVFYYKLDAIWSHHAIMPILFISLIHFSNAKNNLCQIDPPPSGTSRAKKIISPNIHRHKI